MRGILLLFTIWTLCEPVVVVAAEKRNQLEELVIWKMSDELKLNSTEEKKFTEIVQSLNQKKAQANQAMQASLEKLGKLSTIKEKEEELSRYRKNLQNYGRIAEEEFDRLKPVLGPEKMIQYLQIKQDLTNRIKMMLSKPDGGRAPSKPLPQPKLIEEK